MKNHMIMKSIIVMLILSLAVLVFTPNVSADAPTIVYVDDDFTESDPNWNVTNFSTLRPALENVSIGGAVYLWDGIYYSENLLINKSLSLIGNESKPVIQYIDEFEGFDDMITIDADNVLIKNVHINGSGTNNDAIWINLDYEKINITENIFTNISNYCVDGYYSLSEISYNEVYDDCVGGFCCYGFPFEEFVATGNNFFFNNITGLGDCEGFSLYYGVMDSNIYNNSITEGGNWCGISMGTVDNITIYNNTVTGFTGIFTHGIEIYSDSTNVLAYNNFFNNTHNAYDEVGIDWNITKTLGTNIVGGLYMGGNYWSDYNGTDSDDDGLGDTEVPYNSSDEIVSGGDYLPLLLPEEEIVPPPEGGIDWIFWIEVTFLVLFILALGILVTRKKR